MSNQILVLKTSIASKKDVKKIDILLDCHPQIVGWNIDLENCDKILQVVCNGITEADIVELLHLAGYEAETIIRNTNY